MARTFRYMTRGDFIRALDAGAITKDEIAHKKTTTKVGDKIMLWHQVPGENDASVVENKYEACTVIAKYPHVVVFQRPRNRSRKQTQCTRTWVELCMADRGHKI